MRLLRLLVLAAILVLFASPLDLAYTAPGSTFTATSVLDTVDAAPGDGQCADSIGTCTLRAAVMEANASAGPDTIVLLEDTYNLTIGGVGEEDAATGDLDLKGNLTISGAGPEKTIIDAEQSGDRIFHILSGANVSISGITIRNSDLWEGGGGLKNEGTLSITNSTISGNSSNVSVGGGIFNTGSGKLTLADSEVSGNISGGGGGIFNSGEITITNSTVSDNKAPGESYGGGLNNCCTGRLTLADSVVSGNTAGGAGGISNSSTITITNSTVSDNKANPYEGGGITNWNGDIIIINSTISRNEARLYAGGIYNGNEIKLINSTISGNWTNGSGGGIYNENTGTLDARNATIVSNTANADAIGLSSNGGGIKNHGGIANLFNTILALNIHTIDGGGFPIAVDDDCNGALNQLSYSLLTTTTGCSFTNDNSITEQNPKLESLADNGGATQTRAIKADSPAIDAGDPNGCKDPEANELTTDQRGEFRPFDGDLDGSAVCDIGAYEFIIYQQLTVNKTGSGDGRISSSPAGIDCGQDCSASLAQNTIVSLTADPDAGSAFSGWSGACSGPGDCEIMMDAAKNVTATFTLVPAGEHALSISLAGDGTGTVTGTGVNCFDGAGADCTEIYTQGTVVTLTATPDSNSTFSGWSGACSGTVDCQITMESAKSVTATFELSLPIPPTGPFVIFLPLTQR